jgi:transcriptional regulator GlxA family with amidase domain
MAGLADATTPTSRRGQLSTNVHLAAMIDFPLDPSLPNFRSPVDIAIPIYDGLTALDAVGPYEVLSRLPGATVHFVAAERGVIRTDSGMLGLVADLAWDEMPQPAIIVVPGGPSARDVASHQSLTQWLSKAHETSRWTASVCTGSLLLGAAGILDGLRATSHWLDLETLERYGATPVRERVVEEPGAHVLTCAGVSAGIDMALLLAARLTVPEVAEAIQLGIEYDPEPPFDSGTPAKAAPEIVELVRVSAKQDQGAW